MPVLILFVIIYIFARFCYLIKPKKFKTVLSLVLWMRARVDDAVHVQIEVVELHLVGIGLTGVHRGADPIDLRGLKCIT